MSEPPEAASRMAEGVGLEPTRGFRPAGFRDRSLANSGHPSVPLIIIIESMTRLLKVLAVFLLLIVALVAFHRSLLNAAGRWLIVEDPIERADVIVLLSGGPGDERVRQAAALFHEGYAPRVLLSGGEEMLGISIPEVLRRQALAHGIPAGALLFESGSTSTYEQARELLPQFQAMGVRRAIVITSPYHSRRTRYLFRKVFGGTPVDLRVFPVQDSVFDSAEWWTREGDTERVVLEYIKLILSLFR